jgi:FixJ family two-component response regulator
LQQVLLNAQSVGTARSSKQVKVTVSTAPARPRAEKRSKCVAGRKPHPPRLSGLAKPKDRKIIPWVDPRAKFRHVMLGCNSGCPAMPSRAGESAIVHIVDDDASMRGALKGLFDSVGLTALTYGAAGEFLAAPPVDRPGCIVIDIRLPDMNGLDFQVQLTQMDVRLPVVMMTGHGDIPMSVRAMKLGAVDFLPKPFHDQDMLDAVMAAIERDRRRRAVDGDISRLQHRFGSLSPREQQVMLLVTAGKMNKQVANELRISEITVKIHRGAAMQKMGARSLADLVRMSEVIKPKQE